MEVNRSLSESVLSNFGEKLVDAQAKSVAMELSWMLKGRNYRDYDRLRKDEALRKIATQNVIIDDRKAGYVDVLDNKGVSVLHPNKGRGRTQFYRVEGAVSGHVGSGPRNPSPKIISRVITTSSTKTTTSAANSWS